MSYSVAVCPECGSHKINWAWKCLNCRWEPTTKDTGERWVMEVKIGDKEKRWIPVAPASGGKPYEYATRQQAEHMLHICYPDQLREDRLGGLTFDDPTCRVRVFKVEP